MITAPAPALLAFADEVGPADPIVCEGGRTHWDLGGPPDPAARVVRAPGGVVEVLPAEMIVRVRAGTTMGELSAALAEVGQEVPVEAPPEASIGGVLAAGRGGPCQLGLGPVRDCVLELSWVSADGDVVRNGGPVVKNVSGFDLCRLLVGSLGTLGVLAEAVLRTRPIAAHRAWLAGPVEPAAVVAALHAPTSVLWDGTTTWARVDGGGADVDEQRRRGSAIGLSEVAGPPPLPEHRWSTGRDQLLRHAPGHGRFVAAVGVGVVWSEHPGPSPRLARTAAELNRRVKRRFDPSGRLNPGRDVLAGVQIVEDEELRP